MNIGACKMSLILPQGFDDVVFDLYGNVGFPAAILIEMLYLLRTHKNICLISSEIKHARFDSSSVDWFCAENLMMKYEPGIPMKDIVYQDSERILKVPRKFADLFRQCLKNSTIRFILLPLRLVNDTCKSPDIMHGLQHANMLLYDRKTRILERFEPWGFSNNFDNHKFDVVFGKWILQKDLDLPVEWYLGATEFCPRVSFQKLQEEESVPAFLEYKTPNIVNGFCSVWSNWYINLRLSNPDMAPADVIRESIESLKKHPDGFSKFILKYANFVRTEAFNIFKEIGIDMDPRKSFLDQFLKNDNLQDITEKINSEIKNKLF